MNELKLSLQNFQSISHGELTFQTGLNFIIGQSNSGKSATFRALKACLVNPIGSQKFIKKGTAKAVVSLQYNGQNILWERSKKENNYIINGETYFKTGRSNAFKIVVDDLGFIQDDNGDIMNIEEELQLPFPFGISGVELFKLFENVFCVSDSAVILKSAKDYEKSVNDEIDSLEIEAQKAQVKINALQEFKKFLDIEKLKNFKKNLEENTIKLKVLKEDKEIIDLAVKLDKKELEIENRDFKNLLPSYLDITNCKKEIIRIKKLQALNKSLQEFPRVKDSLLLKYNELKDISNVFNQVKKLDELEFEEREFKDYTSSYYSLVDLKNTRNTLKKLSQIRVKEVTFTSKLGQLENLIEYKVSIEELKNKISYLKEEQKRLDLIIRDLKEKLGQFKVCPLCHNELKEDLC